MSDLLCEPGEYLGGGWWRCVRCPRKIHGRDGKPKIGGGMKCSGKPRDILGIIDERNRCPHLADPPGDDEANRVYINRGRKCEKSFGLWGCSLHGRVLPNDFVDGATCCQRCDDYPAK